jgi:hypothetical protein
MIKFLFLILLIIQILTQKGTTTNINQEVSIISNKYYGIQFQKDSNSIKFSFKCTEICEMYILTQNEYQKLQNGYDNIIYEWREVYLKETGIVTLQNPKKKELISVVINKGNYGITASFFLSSYVEFPWESVDKTIILQPKTSVKYEIPDTAGFINYDISTTGVSDIFLLFDSDMENLINGKPFKSIKESKGTTYFVGEYDKENSDPANFVIFNQNLDLSIKVQTNYSYQNTNPTKFVSTIYTIIGAVLSVLFVIGLLCCICMFCGGTAYAKRRYYVVEVYERI